jgi:hypothetical protein
LASSKEEQEFASVISASETKKTLTEGSEDDDFWKLLKGKQKYPLSNIRQRRQPRLFECSIGSGVFKVDEIQDFAQDDLNTHDVFILDAFDSVSCCNKACVDVVRYMFGWVDCQTKRKRSCQ